MHSSSLRSPPPGVVRGQSVLSYHKAKNRTKAATLPGLGTVGVRGPNPQNRTDTSWGQLAKPPCEREDGYIIHSQLARWPGALTLHPNSQSAQPPCLWPVYPCHKNCALPSPLQHEFRQHRGVEFAFSPVTLDPPVCGSQETSVEGQACVLGTMGPCFIFPVMTPNLCYRRAPFSFRYLNQASYRPFWIGGSL
jgi:hypothetical protein